MLVKVVAAQSRLGKMFSLSERLLIFKQKPDFVCLPEYCLVKPTDPDFTRSALRIKDHLEYLAGLSIAFSTRLIGGSVVEAADDILYNSSYFYDRGQLIGKYRKLNPVSGEIEKGILPGDKVFAVTLDKLRIGILICADVLNIDLFDVMGKENVDIVFIPTTSRLRPGESALQKLQRDNDIYIEAARKASCYIVKTCGVGQLFGNNLQGRTLIASPWGIIKQVPPDAEDRECILSAVLDIEELRDFKLKRQLVTDTIMDKNFDIESDN
jgi:predicted amidohydrolase